MVDNALKMKDYNYINYLCFCLELGLTPCRVESLEKFMEEKEC